MKISGFTFLRNGCRLGYPFAASIRSVLPLVDEFVVALGPSDDGTEEALATIADPKLRVIRTTWNERIRNDLGVKGFVYGQQKSIALFNCTGDWAFYLEGDEVVHEDDLPAIRASMERHLDDDRVEAMVFDYLHFYGNGNTVAWSPAWYRRAPRILRNTIPVWAPKGLFFTVLESQKRARYPRAVHAGGRIFHYGWVRGRESIQATRDQNHKFWSDGDATIDLDDVDPGILRSFTGTHPAAIRDWLPDAEGMFYPDAVRPLTRREKKHRVLLGLERALGLEVTKKHYIPAHGCRFDLYRGTGSLVNLEGGRISTQASDRPSLQ